VEKALRDVERTCGQLDRLRVAHQCRDGRRTSGIAAEEKRLVIVEEGGVLELLEIAREHRAEQVVLCEHPSHRVAVEHGDRPKSAPVQQLRRLLGGRTNRDRRLRKLGEVEDPLAHRRTTHA
jgi:hypothetical protein